MKYKARIGIYRHLGQLHRNLGRNEMIHKLIYGMKLLLGRDTPGRNLTVREDDVFISSYPKSGNTWTRFLVANLIHPQEAVTFLNIDHIVPDPDLRSRNFLKNCPRPRVMKSHHPFDPRYKRVICIVRDPRDVALSQYHFQIKRGLIKTGHPMEEFVQRFVAGETNEYGSWGQNVGSWLIARHHTPGFLLLRYEDLKERPEEGLAQIAGLLGLEVDGGQLARAVELSSADRMRKLEKLQAGKWASTRETRKDLAFVRSAVAGEWKSGLPHDAVAQIERAWGHIMRVLGYETVTTATTAHGEGNPIPLALMEIPLNDVRT
jgi:Sulfotransferase domain